MFDTDEIEAKLEEIKTESEELFDVVQVIIKEIEGTDGALESEWRRFASRLYHAIEILSSIGSIPQHTVVEGPIFEI